MGLEAASFVTQLVATNPLAGDKKNVGDDHLRLIKAALQGSFPNANRAFRIPEILSKSANYSVVEADDNKTILCDTTATFTLTLPTPSFAGWMVRVMKSTYDVNPVFVAPPSGTINTPTAAVARVRCNVPFLECVFIWTGSSFVKLSGSDSTVGQLEASMCPVPPVGNVLATGQSMLRADFPELFAIWGVTHGAADGTHFNAPNPLNRFFVGAGSIYALVATGGANAIVIAQTNLPNYTLPDTLGVSDTRTWGLTGTSIRIGDGGGPPNTGVGVDVSSLPVGVTAGTIDITGSVTSGGSDTPIDTRPPYLGVNYSFRMC